MENVPGKERDRIEEMCDQTRDGRKDSRRASETADARENLKEREGERKPVSVCFRVQLARKNRGTEQ